MKEKLIIIRNFLYRLFVIGFILNLGAQFVFMAAAKGQGVVEVSKLLSVTPYYLGSLVSSSIIVIRVIFLYFVLLPALALHWTIARDKMYID